MLKNRKKLRSVEGLNWATYLVEGKHYNRIPYGQEVHEASIEDVCLTCEVKKGQLHLLGCDMESCPACGKQAINCECGEGYKEE